MRWQLQRGVLQPPSSDRPGSPWWRAVNERILRDGCEAVALSGDLPGPASSRTVDHWLSFADYPTARAWYRAHNGSVVAAYLEHRGLAEAEGAAERFFMNVVLCRVLYTHALVAAPRISLGWLRPLAPSSVGPLTGRGRRRGAGQPWQAKRKPIPADATIRWRYRYGPSAGTLRGGDRPRPTSGDPPQPGHPTEAKGGKTSRPGRRSSIVRRPQRSLGDPRTGRGRRS
jgi:hypothetical protein